MDSFEKRFDTIIEQADQVIDRSTLVIETGATISQKELEAEVARRADQRSKRSQLLAAGVLTPRPARPTFRLVQD